MRMTCRIGSVFSAGMMMCASARGLEFSIELGAYALKVPAQTLALADGRSVAVSAAELRFEAPERKSGEVSGKAPRGPDIYQDRWYPWPKALVPLPKADTLILGSLYKSVAPDSVRVTSASGETKALDRDYLYDPRWPAILNKDGGLGAPGSAQVNVAFDYFMQRLDLIQVNAEGLLSVKTGGNAIVCPELPEADAGCHPVAGVYIAPFYDQAGILREDVCPVTKAALDLPAADGKAAAFLEKFKGAGTYRIGFIGDSITAGAEAGQWWDKTGKTWRELVFNTMTHAFPEAQFEELAGYKGGANSSAAAGLAEPVIEQDPSLVFIAMGANDAMGPNAGPTADKPKTPVEDFKKNIRALVESCKAKCPEVVLLTPIRPFKGFPSHGRMDAYAAAIKAVGAETGTPVVDILSLWDQWPALGAPSFTLLHNWYNHPGVRGHRLIAQGVVSALGLDPAKLAAAPREGGVAKDELGGGAWREMVKTRKVIQPAKHIGEWTFTPQPFPPIETIVALEPDDVPLYGCYSWGGEYKEFRKDIQAVGWTTYRLGGFIDEPALIMAMEDGVEIMYTLQIGRSLEELRGAGKRNAFASDEEFIRKFKDVVDEFCGRYGPGGTLFKERPDLARNPVRYIELWNEANFQYMIADEPDMKKVQAERDRLYAKLLKDIGPFIKAKYPDMRVLAFAAGGSAADDKRFIANVYALEPDIGTCYDILSTHPYTHSPPMADRIRSWGTYSVVGNWKAIQDTLAKRGDSGKPIWYTEVGWPIQQSDGGQFPDREVYLAQTAMNAAACVTKMYVLASRLGVRRVHVMSCADADHFNSGFFARGTREWRPSAYAVQQMIRVMPRPRILAALSEETGGLYAYQFKSDWKKDESSEVIVAWREKKSGDIAVPLPAGKKVAKVYNMLGGEEPFTVADGAVKLAGGPLPSYVVRE